MECVLQFSGFHLPALVEVEPFFDFPDLPWPTA
jgi:hypothetical protein